MSVRRKTANRLTLYRTCQTCGKNIVTTADTPWVRQIVIDGRQVTCYFCSETCKRESYKHPGWWDGLADARRRAKEAARDVREKITPHTQNRSVNGRISVTGRTRRAQGRTTATSGRKGD